MALIAEFFGGTPKVPAFKPIDPQAEQRKAIAGNLASLPALQSMASQTNTFNQAETERMLAAMLPGYENIKNKVGSNITSMVSGQIPKDVSDAVQRNSAVKALYGGFSGSGMGRNLTARDLGLTSLNLTQQGLDSATRWMSATRVNPVDISGMFITPQFQTQFAAQERNAEFQRDYVENQWEWYGSAGQQAVRFENTLSELVASIAGAAMGACWVAREVFGCRSVKWLLFRHWLFHNSPAWFKSLYLAFGERFAEFIRNKPRVKAIIRRWMNARIKETLV